MKIVMLTGGGIDSSVLLVWAKKQYDVHLLHVDYGQKALAGERASVEYFAKKYDVPIKTLNIELNRIASASIMRGKALGSMQVENKLEGRNVILLGLAATYAATIDAQQIQVGYHAEPENAPFPDATLETLKAMEAVIKVAYDSYIEISAPFGGFTRDEIFKLGLELDPETITKSFTCYEGGRKECGMCVHCKTKKEILARLRGQGCVV